MSLSSWRSVAGLIGLTLALSAASAEAAPRSKSGARATTATRASAKRRAPPKRLPAGYAAHVRRWHEKQPGATAPLDASGRPKLVLEAINLGERVELESSSSEGGFSEAEQQRARHLLRDGRKDDPGSTDPALLDLLYRIQLHFDAPCIRVISAHRAPKGSRESQHTRGRAADIAVPGASDSEVAAWVRSLGGTGVGLYPRSGFVHVDVREHSHSWVDGSGPGKRAPAKRRGTGKRTRAARGSSRLGP